jgi:hypothetical protein
LIGRQFFIKIDRRRRTAQVKADRPGGQLALERRRQQVLPGVLLHVIEPAVPVDMPAHAAVLFERAIDQMRDVAILVVEDVEHPGLVERPDVEGLPAGGGIKRRAIEHHFPLVVLALHFAHHGVELDQVRVCVIEAIFSH